MRKDPKKGEIRTYSITHVHVTHTSSVSATEAQCSPSNIHVCTPTITGVTLREKGETPSTHPTLNTMLRSLKYFLMAGARLGEVAGARTR